MYRDRLQAAFDALQFDQPFRVILPDGSAATHGQGQPAFTIHIKTNRAARDIIIKSSLASAKPIRAARSTSTAICKP